MLRGDLSKATLMRVFRATLIVIGLTACSSSDLIPIVRPPPVRDDDLIVRGTVCARPPETRVSPLRLLFVIDTSTSMEATDPVGPDGRSRREISVEETWTRLLAQEPDNVRVGIIGFNTDARSFISPSGPYFTGDTGVLTLATAMLANTSSFTNYANALDQTYAQLRNELSSLKTNAEASLSNTDFVVVFASDGIPDTRGSGGGDNTREIILEKVREARELAERFRVRTFAFNTVFLAQGRTVGAEREAEDLLQAMALEGNGTYRSFASGESLDFLFVGVTVLRRAYSFRGVQVIPENALNSARQVDALRSRLGPLFDGGISDAGTPDGAMDEDLDAGLMMDGGAEPDASVDIDAGPYALTTRGDSREFLDLDRDQLPSCGEFLSDTDGDLLADLFEDEIGTDPLLDDMDDDGLRDGIEQRLIELTPPGNTPVFDPRRPPQGNQPRCIELSRCIDLNDDDVCDCIFDSNLDGICDCAEGIGEACVADGLDCVDLDMDGTCDCRDRNGDGRCDYPDSDGDGLRDCEEQFLGTAVWSVDTDGDGLTDLAEVRARTSPVAFDFDADFDSDLTSNGTEVLSNTDPWCNESRFRSRMSQQYSLSSRGLEQIDGSSPEVDAGFEPLRACFDFEATNITLVPTRTAPGNGRPGNGWNRILVYAGDSPFDDASERPAWRVACLLARYDPDGVDYRLPASGRIRLRDEDFIHAEVFDADVHCREP